MPDSREPVMKAYSGGVVAVDSGFSRSEMAACFLVEGGSRVAVVETGTNASVPLILDALRRRGWKPSDVQYVVVTHVHLDHAGGAGKLMNACYEAELLVHPRGGRHMVDPSRLEAGVRAVYGDEVYDRDYGALVPVDSIRVREMEDGATAFVGERPLLFRDSPGHARHHFSVWDEQTRGWFTGDTFGLSYRETDTANGPFIFPTTTPVQFDPAALKSSINMLLAAKPECVYLTHYGRVDHPARLAPRLFEGIDEFVRIAEAHAESTDRTTQIENDMMNWLVEGARAHGVTLEHETLEEVLRNDVMLNTQGLEFWLDHR